MGKIKFAEMLEYFAYDFLETRLGAKVYWREFKLHLLGAHVVPPTPFSLSFVEAELQGFDLIDLFCHSSFSSPQ